MPPWRKFPSTPTDKSLAETFKSLSQIQRVEEPTPAQPTINMPAPPSSLQTPRHSRNSSLTDSCLASPQNRRCSKSSIPDAPTSFRDSLVHHDGMDISVLSSGGAGVSNGMGNLADELADAFSDSGEDDYDEENTQDRGALRNNGGQRIDSNEIGGSVPEGAAASSSGNGSARANDGHLGLLSPHRRGHLRKSSQYDGNEHNSDSDLDAPGISPSLMAKIDAVDSLARRGTDDHGNSADDVLKRVISNLRELGSQSGVEGSATRLITAHSALTTHLSNQTRQLHNLTVQLLSPLSPSPDPETIDTLVPLLMSLSEDMPRPSTSAFKSLTALHSMTSELIQILNYLSDTLHMSRQATVTATRRLKSVKELVAEMRRDEELREEGEQWLARGNWCERLEKRECADVCGEVIGGFEDVCNGWRERLLAQAESQA